MQRPVFAIQRDTIILIVGFVVAYTLIAGARRYGSVQAYLAYAAVQIATYWVVFLMSVTLHEVAHGYVAYRAGDNTARLAGRLSLNPLRHLDMVGTLMFLAAGIGWAKPVPVDPRRFKDRKIGQIAVSAAGPAANVLLALVGLLGMWSLRYVYGQAEWNALIEGLTMPDVRGRFLFAPALLGGLFLWSLGFLNVLLAVFNLLPIAPLDGSHLLKEFLPIGALKWYEANQGTITMIGFVGLMLGLFEPIFRFFVGLWISVVFG